MKNILLFSGQGSQYYGMGKGLYQQNAIFRQEIQTLNSLIYRLSSIDICGEVFAEEKNIGDAFDQPLESSLAIYLFERALAKLVMHYCPIDGIASSSMGILAASATVDGLSDEANIRFILGMSSAYAREAPKGTMIAVLANVESYHKSPILKEYTQIAGINFSESYIVSVLDDNLAVVEANLREAGLIYQKLPVRYPYHSTWLAPAKHYVLQALQSQDFAQHSLQLPLYCASQVKSTITQLTPEDYWQAFICPMEHLSMVKQLEAVGPNHYIDCSPSGTLANIFKYAAGKQSQSIFTTLLSPFQSNPTAAIENMVKITRENLTRSYRIAY
ncbi:MULTISPECIES: acyltransferase domain-containing protein [unclassified Pseudoalteromonas]|uniref:acyltransferase domain-containing protein n=1 Tax=unclassified Pseudoalteromonas TaxID=194690 RepID=UPI0025B57E48|nr:MULTISPECIES: acyltransferase domain-containing protein [unclassified Pseudoalteromonas]MDN3379165.1 acyltransferase domain-containing protein [Pseudoalteromonas sp. APC 3893]MDN3387660.1 acyltransferase domain-containing protein [Pseudoalteromonas sp. APC 4017]